MIDPKQEGDAYPYKGICGAVVAYKVMEALYRRLELTQKEKPLLEELLEMAAFATVCDVMELLDENRVIVKFRAVPYEKHLQPGTEGTDGGKWHR